MTSCSTSSYENSVVVINAKGHIRCGIPFVDNERGLEMIRIKMRLDGRLDSFNAFRNVVPAV